MPLGKVADHSRKTLQFPVFILEGNCVDIRPKARSVMLRMPVFTAEVAPGSSLFKFCQQRGAEVVFAWVETGHMLADDLFVFIAVNSFCAGVASDDLAIRIQQKECEVFHP